MGKNIMMGGFLLSSLCRSSRSHGTLNSVSLLVLQSVAPIKVRFVWLCFMTLAVTVLIVMRVSLVFSIFYHRRLIIIIVAFTSNLCLGYCRPNFPINRRANNGDVDQWKLLFTAFHNLRHARTQFRRLQLGDARQNGILVGRADGITAIVDVTESFTEQSRFD